MCDDTTENIEITRAQNRNYAIALGFRRAARESNFWSLFMRYQAQAERQYRRALEEFERIQALRNELPNEPICEGQPNQMNRWIIPKRTHFPAKVHRALPRRHLKPKPTIPPNRPARWGRPFRAAAGLLPGAWHVPPAVTTKNRCPIL